MKNKYGLRQMDWPELIVHFITIEDKEDFNAKDLVDYFHFQYLNQIELGRWTTPDYIREKRSAQKLLEIYGKKDCIDLVKILFEEYNIIVGKQFNDIRWSLGLLSSDKCANITHDALVRLKTKNQGGNSRVIADLLNKPREDWTPEETQLFEKEMTKQ